MPTYEAECPACGECFDYHSSMAGAGRPPRCITCGAKTVKVIMTAPKIQPDMDDFSQLNGGRGLWNDQLNTYVKSKQDTIDKGKARGLKPIG